MSRLTKGSTGPSGSSTDPIYIQNQDTSWKGNVGTLGDLPLVGNTDGDKRTTVDTGNIYVWYSGAWHNKTVGGGGGGQVDSVQAGTLISVNATDPENPIVSFTGTIPTALADLSDDATHRLVTDVEKGVWNGKIDASALTPYFNKSVDTSDDVTTGTNHLFLDSTQYTALTQGNDADGQHQHPSYQALSEKDQPSGYPSLDINGLLPYSELTYHNHEAGFDDAPTITEGSGGDAGKYSIGTVDVFFFDNETKDTTTLHTIADSGWMTPDGATDGKENFVCADRDTDTWVQLTALPLFDELRYCPAFMVEKRTSSNNLHHEAVYKRAHGDRDAEYSCAMETHKFDVAPTALRGMAVDTSLNFTMSGGAVWIARRIRYVLSAVTTATRQFRCVVSAGVWSIASNTSPYLDNTHFNDVAVGYDTLTDGYWGNAYFWRGVEDQDHCYTVLGTQEYASSDLAIADNTIPNVPNLISSHAVFVGRVTFQKSATTGFIIKSAYDESFSGSTPVTSYNSLTDKPFIPDTLDSLTDVVTTMPMNGQGLFYDGANWVNQNTPISGGAGLIMFMDNNASDVGTYLSMAPQPVAAGEVYKSATINSTSGEVVIQEFISAPGGLLRTLWDGGIWACNTFVDVSALTGTTLAHMKLYKRTSGGAETLLFECTCGEVNSITVQELICETIQPDFVTNSTDRMVIKYTTETTSITDVTVNFYYQGTAHYSHLHTPLATLHNEIAGIQGGIEGERNHISNAELAVITNLKDNGVTFSFDGTTFNMMANGNIVFTVNIGTGTEVI